MISFEDFAARLKGRQGSDDDFTAYCPAHADREHRSLHVTRRHDGGVLANCFVGCTWEQIIAALQLTTGNGVSKRPPLRLEEFAAAKGLPLELLADAGVKQERWGLRITYFERDGVPARQQRRRTALRAKDGSLWEKGAGSPIPYGRWRLEEAMEKGELLLVEGETDVLTGWLHHVPTLGIPGADMAKVLDAADLTSIQRLHIVREPGQGGETFISKLGARLATIGWRGSAFIVVLPAKDLNELHLQAGARFAEALVAAKASARPLSFDAVDVTNHTALAARRPVLVRVADVAREQLEWLWPRRIARGKFQALIGDPGLGKSTLLLAFAAHLSVSRPWPDGTPAPHGPSVILTAEDGLGDTVRPRLDQLGADLSKISVLRAVRTDNGDARFSLHQDLAVLEAAIRETGAIFVGIDPVSAYIGDVDSYKDAELRSVVLAPLAELAERTRVAIMGVLHLTKDQQRSVIYRAQGSIAWVGQARLVHIVTKDRDVDGRRLFVTVKSNLAQEPPALAYRLEERRCVTWEGAPVAGTAETLIDSDEVLTRTERRDREQAKTFLRDLLAAGPVSSRQIASDAKANGIAERTLWRAKAELGVQAERAKTASGKEAWYWFMSASDDGKAANDDGKAANEP